MELKSVNHRFLELALNLPRRFWALEDRFRKLIKSRVARGRVDMQLSWESFEEKSVTLRLDMGLVAGVRDVLEQLRLAGNTPESLKLEHFLHFSDLLVAKEQANQDLELEAAWETVSQAVNQALDLLDEMRLTEGAALAADLAGSLADIRREISRIVVLAPRLPRTLAGEGRELAWRSFFPRAARWTKPAWPRKWPSWPNAGMWPKNWPAWRAI